MRKILFSFLVLATAGPSFAELRSQKLVLYQDCVGQEIQPVDVIVAASGNEFELSSNVFVSGIDISLVENTETGELQSVRFGKAIELPFYSFAAGVTFSAFDKILHTVEIVDFGGLRSSELVVRMGHLLNFDPVDLIRAKLMSDPGSNHLAAMRRRGESGVSRHLKDYYGNRWREFTFKVVRIGENWEVRNLDGNPFTELYTILSVGLGGVVKGLEEIRTVDSSLQGTTGSRPFCYKPNAQRTARK